MPTVSLSLATANICIVGLVRDCEAQLSKQFDILAETFSWSTNLAFFLVESDSTDQTLAVLAAIQASHPRFSFVSLGNLAASIPERTSRLAYCRNVYLEHLRQCRNDAGLDYFVVADMDGINSGLTTSSVLSCWDVSSAWDVQTANQKGFYYDIYALRHPKWAPVDAVSQAKFFRSHGLSYFASEWINIYSRMIRIQTTAPPIEVDSAFGGLAVYRAHCLDGCQYSGTLPYSEPICEHVPFNYLQRKHGRRILINPALINTSFAEQARYAGLIGLLRFSIRCVARSLLRLALSLRKSSALSR